MTLEDQKFMRATSTFQGRKRSKTFGKGRTCSNESCEVTLSMYNPRDTCYLHTPLKVPRLRGEYLRKEG